MATAIRKTCKICGTEYEVCLSCERNHGWKVHTDTLDHYYIFLALMAYEMDHDAARAYKALTERGIDLDDTSALKPFAREMLAEIRKLGREKSGVKRTKAAEASEPVYEPAPVPTESVCGDPRVEID